MNQTNVERTTNESRVQSAGTSDVERQSLQYTTLAADSAKYQLQFGVHSHEGGHTNETRVLIYCSTAGTQTEFRGWISHQRPISPRGQESSQAREDRLRRHFDTQRVVNDSVHQALNDEANFAELKKVCNTAAFEHERISGQRRYKPVDNLDELAASKCAWAFGELYSEITEPKSLDTIFRPVKPQYPTTKLNTFSTLGREATDDGVMCPPLRTRVASQMMARSLEAGDKLDLGKGVVWVNPDLAGEDRVTREVVLGYPSSKKPMSTEDQKERKLEFQRIRRRREHIAASGSSSTDAAGSVVPINSRGMPRQTSSRRGSDMGLSGMREPKSYDLKEGKEREASSSVRAGRSRNLCPFPNPNRSPHSEVSPNGSTALWTPKSFAKFLEAPDSASQTSLPGHSNGSHSPGLENWSQYGDSVARRHRLPSSPADQQASGQYLQASDLPDFDTTVLPHRPADYTPNSNYQATSTNFGPSPYTVPHNNSPYPPPQEQTYQPSLYHNSTFDHGQAGRVPHIGSTDQFGRSIPTEAMAHYNTAGWIGNSQNQSYQDSFSEEEITRALSNTATLTLAPESFRGWGVNRPESNQPQILLTPARVLQDEPELDWETPPR
jgi:hypothetical protein